MTWLKSRPPGLHENGVEKEGDHALGEDAVIKIRFKVGIVKKLGPRSHVVHAVPSVS